MTRIYRVEVFIVDHDAIGPEGVKSVLENARYPNRAISPHVVSIDTRNVEWSDDHPLNKRDGWRPAYDELFSKHAWPCPGKPEELKGQPIGMYHCEFCGEMQLAGASHLPPQVPSQWHEPFPKTEEPDYGDEGEEDGGEG